MQIMTENLGAWAGSTVRLIRQTVIYGLVIDQSLVIRTASHPRRGSCLLEKETTVVSRGYPLESWGLLTRPCNNPKGMCARQQRAIALQRVALETSYLFRKNCVVLLLQGRFRGVELS